MNIIEPEKTEKQKKQKNKTKLIFKPAFKLRYKPETRNHPMTSSTHQRETKLPLIVSVLIYSSSVARFEVTLVSRKTNNYKTKTKTKTKKR